jgi:multimeric flavodoxin WrbA
MKVLGIVGSPRVSGNTEFYMTQALAELAAQDFQTELLLLRQYRVQPCLGCYHCATAEECSQQDDDFCHIYNKMRKSQGIILGTPVYYSGVVPGLMALLDRAGFLSRATGEYFSGKVGGPITVARRAGHNFALAQLLLWFNINDMVVPGGRYWNVGVAGAKGARNAADDTEGIETVRYFARNMAHLIKLINNNGK